MRLEGFTAHVNHILALLTNTTSLEFVRDALKILLPEHPRNEFAIDFFCRYPSPFILLYSPVPGADYFYKFVQLHLAFR